VKRIEKKRADGTAREKKVPIVQTGFRGGGKGNRGVESVLGGWAVHQNTEEVEGGGAGRNHPWGKDLKKKEAAFKKEE